MANVTDKVRFENPPNGNILGFWIDGEIVCLQCITEEEKKHQTMRGDIIYRKDVEDNPSFDACDRCVRPLIRNS